MVRRSRERKWRFREKEVGEKVGGKRNGESEEGGWTRQELNNGTGTLRRWRNVRHVCNFIL